MGELNYFVQFWKFLCIFQIQGKIDYKIINIDGPIYRGWSDLSILFITIRVFDRIIILATPKY
jgi:hypothetical protein